MKTNFVKKGSEKNIEKFEMSNEELIMVNGGGLAEQYIIIGPDGKPIILIRGENASQRSFSRYF